MKKLSIADLAKRSNDVASQELLNTISGGAGRVSTSDTAFDACHTLDDCHVGPADGPIYA